MYTSLNGHLRVQVVPDVFTSPASGSIYYCSTPDPEMERALVSRSFACWAFVLQI